MDKGVVKGSQVLDVLGDQFLLLVSNLIRGNMKRSLGLAEIARREAERSGLNIASQGMIEELARSQAVKNSLINTPSIVPGLGTLLSFCLLGVENFFLLDQSVTLIVSLCSLHGARVEDLKTMERFTMRVVGEAFGIENVEKKGDHRAISREYITKMLPGKYVNTGINRGVRRMLRRLLPFRSGSRLLPAGIGLGVSALNAYEIMVEVGQLTLKHLPRLLQDGVDGEQGL
jgi:hypothetical protein